MAKRYFFRIRDDLISPTARPAENSCRELVLLDDRPLKRAAWAELHAARKRQEKAARDLHRHEQVDRPAFDRWLHSTFPDFVTKIRECTLEAATKTQQIDSVMAESMYTGRLPHQTWQDHQEQAANPAAAAEAEEKKRASAKQGAQRDPFESQDELPNQDEDPADDYRSQWEKLLNSPLFKPAAPAPTTSMRDVYRRLVQRLHPDRGGEWTATRERLWHEVQQAWSCEDADWLTRLEVEWEAANDVMTLQSPLSRLRLAVTGFDAARRDTERKLRLYRRERAWRFTLNEKKRESLASQTLAQLNYDLLLITAHLLTLKQMIESWEKKISRNTRRRARGEPR